MKKAIINIETVCSVMHCGRVWHRREQLGTAFGTVSRNRSARITLLGVQYERQNVSHAFPNFFTLFPIFQVTHDPNQLGLFTHIPTLSDSLQSASSHQVNKMIRTPSISPDRKVNFSFN